jgi:hypothetical protein
MGDTKKKSKKGKKGKSGKKKGPNDGPTVNELALRRLLKLYDTYSNEMNSKCCPEVIKNIKNCLEEETDLRKVMIKY